jgi:AcrR family transcriptional regulator
MELVRMTEKAHDKMAARTKQLIKETLIELIEEKSFEGITVKDLTVKAGLNRGTFYLHYRDKYDLMVKIQEELLQGFLQIVLQIDPFDVGKYLSKNIPYPVIVQLFTYLKSHSRIIKVLLGPKGDPAFPKKMKEIIKTNFFENTIKNLITFPEEVAIVKEYLPAIGTSVHFGIIEKWLDNDMPHSPEEMAMMYFNIVKFIKVQINKINKI